MRISPATNTVVSLDNAYMPVGIFNLLLMYGGWSYYPCLFIKEKTCQDLAVALLSHAQVHVVTHQELELVRTLPVVLPR